MFVFSRLAPLLLGALLSSAPALARAQDAAPAAPTVFEQTLPDGARVLCRREPDTPLVALQVFVKVGALQDDPRKPGLSNFVAHTLFDGSLDQIPENEQTRIGRLGGNVSATWQPDYTQVSALTLPDQFSEAASLVTTALTQADFDDEAVETARQDILGDIGNADASVFQTDYNGLRRTLYAGTGYTLPPSGTVRSLSDFKAGDLRLFYAQYYVPRNMVFVVIGDIDPQFAAGKIADDLRYFDDDRTALNRKTLNQPVRTVTTVAAAPLPPLTTDPPPVRVAEPDIAEVGVMVGYRAPTVAGPDYPAMVVANALLGGMKTSRLFTNLREKQGLAYELGSVLNTQIGAADVTAFAFAAPTRTDPVTKKSVSAVGFIQEQILHQVALFRAAPPTESELARAKRYLVGSYKMRHERLEDRATLLGLAALQSPDGTRFDTDYARYINAVSAADVQRVAAKYFVHPAISIIEPDGKNNSVTME